MPREHVDQRPGKKHHLGEPEDEKQHKRERNRTWKGWRRERLSSLPDQKRQVLTMRKPLVPTSTSQMMATHQAWTG